MRRGAEWAERRQVPLYLAALAVGAAVGLAAPAVSGPAESAIQPVLGLLLYVTFLGVPFAKIVPALRDWRFLTTVLATNFLAVPAVVLAVSRIVAHDDALLAGVLFVLLTPCVDYVIVFTGIAGGSTGRLLATAPLLMLAQMVLLPVYLRLFLGSGFVDSVDVAPFVEAFLLLIVVPLAAAGLTQAAGRTRPGAALQRAATGAMVPLMMFTLAVVVASQIDGVRARLGALLLVVPVYVLFAGVMVAVGVFASRVARLDVPAGRAVVFSGVTRNSLVVLPLVLALPPAFDLAPLAVVTQTLVELVVMVILVRLVPRLMPCRSGPAGDVDGGPGSGPDEGG
ncbi:arsenic resistance protein [Tomitella fengzijianii]|uniref:Arsenic resistance protein n=1 Tax=Tomitella fengzijianii TaxID=2597660 RepID=A0A516X6U0_9ACTN|nr:bile acid:sodium symporter [Tomitella fengzijianii]QDQ98787.1 arsenic resistance protein [Tomitella fengzijianii]